jgi:hypothetical protein
MVHSRQKQLHEDLWSRRVTLTPYNPASTTAIHSRCRPSDVAAPQQALPPSTLLQPSRGCPSKYSSAKLAAAAAAAVPVMLPWLELPAQVIPGRICAAVFAAERSLATPRQGVYDLPRLLRLAGTGAAGPSTPAAAADAAIAAPESGWDYSPADDGAAAAGGIPSPPPLPPGWTEHLSRTHGRPYYCCSASGAQSWVRPASGRVAEGWDSSPGGGAADSADGGWDYGGAAAADSPQERVGGSGGGDNHGAVVSLLSLASPRLLRDRPTRSAASADGAPEADDGGGWA